MKKNILCVNKYVGETPLHIIQRLKKQLPEYADATISYAGRLDPMAEGLLLLLVDEENKNRKFYEALEKTYTFQFILGIATDSYDLLGKIVESNLSFPTDYTKTLSEVFSELLGEKEQAYPPFSAKPVMGKPLYYWARNNALQDITIPTKKISITHARQIEVKSISASSLLQQIVTSFSPLQGDFRQADILKIWQTFLEKNKTTFPLISAEITCSSGTYVRGIVHEIGQKINFPTVTTSIKRTQIGTFTLADTISLS